MLTPAAVRLADWTTLRLGGPAAHYVEAEDSAELYATVAAADARGDQVLVLGGGSNLVVADAGVPGTVVRVAWGGVRASRNADGVEVTVEAGESWQRLVDLAVEEHWVGIEALAGIPGTVGAVPIQNVGAYGQEVADTIVRVDGYDRVERRSRSLAAAECGFGYRSSAFKSTPDWFVVGAVTFQFATGLLGAPVRYAELARRLEVPAGSRAPAADVHLVVLALRTGKGMVLDADDRDTWSAGSFFTNPFLEPRRLPVGATAFEQPDGRVKVSAAWLIQAAGFAPGYGNERTSLSTKHVLALTNRGSATTDDVLALAGEVQAGVRSSFGIDLHTEPVLVGCTLG